MVTGKDLNIKIVFDNNPFRQDLTTSWGFSCLITGMEKTILFDTGGDGEILLSNMQKLDIDPGTIDIVVLSHAHGDHIGGLERFLAANSAVTVYLLSSFPVHVIATLKNAGIRTREVQEFTMLCEDVYSTGELGEGIKEQSLLVQTERGVIVITGCAHPGIVDILITAKKKVQADEVFLTVGGFHLPGKSREEVKEIAAVFKRIGVRYIAPSHCSGDLARLIFKEENPDFFILVGVGKEIVVKDLFSDVFGQKKMK